MNKKTLKEQYKSILDFLNNWQDEWHLYDLCTFHSAEFYYPLEEVKLLKKYYDIDLTPFFKDKFISFSVDGGGGNYCFWLYPDIDVEPPIVYLDGHGEQEFLASNINDFVSRMINELNFCGDWTCEGDNVEEVFKEDMLWQLADTYQEEKGKEISEIETEKLFRSNRKLFKEKASKLISIRTTEQIKSDFKKHPNFGEWIDMVQQKNDEIYKENQPKDIEKQSVKEQVEAFEGVVKNKILSKIKLITLLKSSKPELYKTSEFQKWMKKK